MDKSIFAAPSSVFGSNIGRNLTTREVTGDPDEDDSPRDHNDKVHDIPRVPERTDVCQNGGGLEWKWCSNYFVGIFSLTFVKSETKHTNFELY